ncbi:DNRLRE domain-containing protein [Anatilimnocola sp. NA78]|uniref:DNRLRE domain-containing protein n=1 Tax=Anatilimnocola sp. NA78 TaxID=3415683 RepID=UPI003CE466BB
MLSHLNRSLFRNPGSRTRLKAALATKKAKQRRLLLETLESREVMDATLHTVAAAYIDVVQNNTGNTAASITTSLPMSINDFQLRGGQSRGDLTVQVGNVGTDDIANGILLTSINDNGRDNGETTISGVQYGISAVNGEAGGTYFIATHNTSKSGLTGGDEYNFNVSAAYFPYADGWIGGLARNSAGTNGGVNDLLVGSPGLAVGTHYISTGGGISTVDLRSMGIHSQTDGVLLVNHGKNENNFALSRANADGTWSVFTKGHNQDGTDYEQDPVAFVYVPKSNTTVISGKFRGDGSAAIASAPFVATNPSTGTYHLEIPGHTPQTGVLVISAEGGAGNNIDNPVSFVANGNGWDIQTRDLPNMGLQNIGANDAVVSFVFIPGPTPGVKVTPSIGLLTTESGGTATFDITLDTAPTADVTIQLSSSNTAEGTISLPSVTFTTANWNVPQTVTVTGQDDALVDGAVAYTIVTDSSTSLDPVYAALNVPDIAIRNADNEVGITVNPISGLTTTEAGGTATFSVYLNTQPLNDVVIGLSSSNTAEGTVSAPTLTFTAANWNVPQVVTVTGVNDAIDEGNVTYTILTAAATSDDPAYAGVNADDVTLSNIDNDTAGILQLPVIPITALEGGAPAPFTVQLQSQPTSDVTIAFSSSDLTAGTVPAQIVFTAANWNVAQTVNVTPTDDFARDGAQTFTVLTTATSTDPLYNNAPIRDVTVVTEDNEALITFPSGNLIYGLGSPAIALGPQSAITDADTANYDAGTLTVTQTGSVESADRLEIRSTGTAAGQISVAGNVVSFGGTAIGTFVGGSGSTPLVITLNAAATPAATEALLRAITFRNIGTSPAFPTRTVSIVLNDGDGGTSNTVTSNIQVGRVNLSGFQEGVDLGYGTYTGQADIQLSEGTPDTALPIGNGTQMFLDWPDLGSTNTSQILMRFDSIFGTGPGQIPLGATIVGAELVLNVSDSGDGGTLHRLNTTWDANTETWNSFGNAQFPRNAQPGVQVDNAEARTSYDSAWGLIDGSGGTGTGRVSIGVTPDLQAWANGEANNGWLITGWSERRDGTGISPGESADSTIRPQLRVAWVPAGVQSTSFRQGVDGYTGAEDAALLQASPDLNLGTDISVYVDAANAGNESQVLLKFNDIVGTGPGQIPAGSRIHAAALTLASANANSMGAGGRFFTMQQPWTEATATWNLFGNNGIQPDGIEASTTFNTQAGNAGLAPTVQGGFNPFDVTADLQAWVSGAQQNNGWAILPWAGGTDEWGFITSNAFVPQELPQLRVFFTPPGFTITPQSGLVTSESGGTANFTIELNTAPTANVTIPLSSSNSSEGTVTPASVTFTPANWNVPQTVTITGVNDALADGAVAYSIVTGAATSTDPAYASLDPADITVTNSDNDIPGITVQPTSGLVTTEAGDTATFTVVLDLAPTANVVITVNSSNTAEGTVAPTTLTFTTADWNIPQTVTVTGADDFDIDGAVNYTIVTSPAVSADAGYNGFNATDVTLTNLDNDVAGVTITPTSGLRTSESGGTATFTVKLNSRPTADVTFGLASSNTAEGTVGSPSLTFTPANWNVEQTVTITGVADALTDVSVDYGIITEAIVSTDLNYNGLNPADVAVTNVDVQPILTLSATPAVYGIGGTAIGIDGTATLIDLDSADLNTGVLTVTLSAGATADDRVEIRNVGTGPGQIGVSGSNVTFGGVAIGTFTGGTGATPLAITFNSSSTPAAAEALLRGITFRNVGTNLATTTRTVMVTMSDGDGSNSQPLSKGIVVGLRRAVSFQEGVDNGLGVYTGAADVELSQAQPDTVFAEGSTASGLTVVGGTTTNSQVLLRFDSLFGNGPGQIPPGSLITFAELVLDVTNTGSGPRLNRMLQTWNAGTATWNTLTGGIQTDDVEARAQYEATLNNASGAAAATTTGSIGIGVLSDLQAWSNGEANNGWAMLPALATNTNDFGFSSSEVASLTSRPRLRVEWVPAGTAVKSFRDGVDGYTGTVDTQLQQAAPTSAAGATSTDLNVDFTDAGNNSVHVLMKFEDIIGAALSQVPAGAIVYAATLTLPAMGSNNAPGDGGSFHPMLQSWTEAATWDSFSAGITADGVEASLTSIAQAGNASRNPDAQAGFNVFDVTGDVQSWVSGSLGNNGWAMLPWASGSNGWIFSSSETANINLRPQLTIFHSLVPAVTVTQTGGTTEVVEGSATDTVALVLATQPTADVTVTINAGTQLTTAPTTLTFTAANWNTPQNVTVSGINDATAEGNHTGTLTFTAASSDAAYNGLTIGSVNVQIADPIVFSVSTFTNAGSTFAVRFNEVLDPTVLNLVDSNGTLGASDITVSGATAGVIRGSVIMDADNRGFTFVKTGGELVPDTYTVTLRSAANGLITSTGVQLDGDGNGVAGGDYVTQFTVVAPAPGTLVVGIPDFVRGYGQPVNLPASTSNGIPITLSSGLNVGATSFTVNYNPSLLTITGGTTPIAGANITVDVTTPGVAIVTITSATEFSATATPITIANLAATVPASASNGSKHVLDLTNVTVTAVNAATLPSVGDDGIHVAAYRGDLNNSRSITTGDVTALLRSISGALSTTGFTSLKLSDPILLGDMNDSLSVTTGDATGLLRFISGAAGGFPAIPALPTGLPVPPPGADPEIFIPDNLTVAPGGTLTIPVNINVTEPTGVSLAGFDVTITYDATRFTFGSATLGSALTGFSFSSSNNTATPGFMRLVYASDLGPALANGFIGTILNVTLNALPAAATGTSALNITAAAASDNDTNDLLIAPAVTAGVDSSDGSVIVGVANAAPTALALAPQTIAENAGANAVVGTFSTTDADAGDTFTYSLVAGAGATDNGLFNISGSTLQATNSLNFEAQPTYSIRVRTTDAGGLFVESTFTVTATNVNEAPVTGAQTFSIAENSANAVPVGTVVATDPDAGDSQTFAITAGNTGTAFAINPTTGQITVANSAALDFETTPSYSLTVTVTDADLLTSTATVTINLTDVFEGGISVSPTAGLTTTESGGTATFTVVLTSQPTADVTIPLSSSDTTEGTIAVNSVTFTALNWNVPQIITVTGADDLIVDGAVTYTIVTGAATSTDVNYAGINSTDVSLTNSDNDAAGITVTPTAGLTTTEAGGTATFTIVLNSQPTADVTIPLTSSDTTEGTVAPASVTFTTANWNVPQIVTITGADDAIVDGPVTYTIVTGAATSTDAGYTGLNAADVSVSNTDNDVATPPGITVTPTAGLTTTEAGGTATFTIVLNSQPTADVTIPLSSSDTTEGTVAPASVTFTTANWNVPQIVTITGADDAIVDGSVAYTIVTGAATSTDAGYAGLNAADVSVANSDNDAAGITVTPTAGLTTTEAGGTATFTIVLNSQPTADVTIPLSSSDTTEGTVAPASVTFTTANWNVPQIVTITGADDAIVDGSVAYTIVTGAATSTDAGYAGLNAADVSVSNTDNDVATPPGITVTPTAGLTTTEAGGTATFTIVLNSQPTADVTIPLSSSDTTEGTVAPASVTFTTANWNVPQIVTITGADDAIVDGSVAYTIVTGAATSTDAGYTGLNAADVSVSNTDNDVVTPPGITVTPTAGLTTTEAGGTATFTIVLNSQPTADVTIPLSSSDITEGTVAPASVTFTTANWNIPQIVTVTGADDLIVDGSVAYTIVTGAATSTDAGYTGLNAADVSVANSDNDVATPPGITVTPTAGLTTTEAGGTATFTIVLNSQPTADVTIPLTSSDTTEGTVAPASVTFTTANWNVPQIVTITGADDAIVDGSVAYTIVTGAATSTDAGYTGLNAADVSVANSDNDTVGVTPGFTISPVEDLVTTEAGGTATFTIVLRVQPTGNVTIPLVSSDPSEGSLSTSSVTFTPANWNVPQTITITGVDDAIDDGDVAYAIVTGLTSSTDPAYNGRNPMDVSVTSVDNDEAGSLPTISNIADQVTNEDVAITNIPFTVSDGQTAAGSLQVTATSDNTVLFPAGSIVLGGTGADRTISLSPAANAFGTATITVTVDDGEGGTSTDTFVVTVNAVNDAPTLNAIANPAPLPLNAATQSIPLTGISAGAGETQSLTVTATSSNPALIANPTIVYSSPGSTGTLTFTPVANQSGTATITVTVTDAGGTANGGVNTTTRTFTVTVSAPVTNVPGTAAIVDDPENPGRGLLVVNGTSSLDLITISRYGANQTLVLMPLSKILQTFSNASFDRIVVNALAGDDRVILDPFLAKPTTIYGDAGNDLITGGAATDLIDGGTGDDIIWGRGGNDIILGDAGRDYLYGEADNDVLMGGTDDDYLLGGAGADILNGGGGLDRLFGLEGDDLLIGGVLSQGNDVASLQAIQALWTSNQPFATRISSLAGDINSSTVTSDGKVDWVYGNQGRDWMVDYALMDLLWDFNSNASNGDKRN